MYTYSNRRNKIFEKMKFHLLLFLVFPNLVNSVVNNVLKKKHESREISNPPLLFLQTINDEYLIPLKRTAISFNHSIAELYCVCPSSNDDEVSLVEEANWQEASFYDCERDYKPQEKIYKNMCYGGSYDWIEFSYKVGFKVGKKIKHKEFLIYSLCVEPQTNKTRYVKYKVIPYLPELNKIPEINHSNLFEFSQEIRDIYSQDNQASSPGGILKKFLRKIGWKFGGSSSRLEDIIIPQKLAPTFNISTEYSKGVTGHLLNHQPQWLSLADQWDYVNYFIKIRAYRLNWTIRSGTHLALVHNNEKVSFKIKTNPEAYMTVPLIWWILITTVEKNMELKKGIVIAMTNNPLNSKIEKNEKYFTLCDEKSNLEDTCDISGWKGVKKIANTYIHCCKVTGQLSKLLIQETFTLDLLTLQDQDQDENSKNTTNPNVFVEVVSSNRNNSGASSSASSTTSSP